MSNHPAVFISGPVLYLQTLPVNRKKTLTKIIIVIYTIKLLTTQQFRGLWTMDQALLG